eukprot:244305-Hanusia_phi.AAC.1
MRGSWEGADNVQVEAEGGRKTSKKETFFLDLRSPLPPDAQKLMSKSKASTILAAAQRAGGGANSLPQDHRYMPDSLRRLFLRPRTRLTLRASRYEREDEEERMSDGDGD